MATVDRKPTPLIRAMTAGQYVAIAAALIAAVTTNLPVLIAACTGLILTSYAVRQWKAGGVTGHPPLAGQTAPPYEPPVRHQT